MFELRSIGILTPSLQIFLIVLLFVATALYRYKHRSFLKKEEREYAVHFTQIYAPIYEEILFRGLLFPALLHYYSLIASIIISSLLFGIWHLKNIYINREKRVTYQILYAGFVVGPILAIIAYTTQTIWIGVIFHYINNLWSTVQWNVYEKIGVCKYLKPIRKFV